MSLRAWINSVKPLLAGVRARRRRLQSERFPVTGEVQSLESRQLLAGGLSVVGTRLALSGTDAADNATVTLAGNLLTASIKSGNQVVTKRFDLTKITIKSIQFTGGNGNDRFDNQTNLPSVAYGGRGKDTLLGGSARDEFYGNDGDDHLEGRKGNDVLSGDLGNDTLLGGKGFDTLEETLYNRQVYSLVLSDMQLTGLGTDTLDGIEAAELMGNDSPNTLDARDFSGEALLIGLGGNDLLYGGKGADVLDGGEGNDGLFGGDGVDSLIGRGGADRFLVQGSEDIVRDKFSEDAVIHFDNATVNWSSHEIRTIDAGLMWLHNTGNSTRLLKSSTGGDLTFERHAVIGQPDPNSVTLGQNVGKGRMKISSAAFDHSSGAAATAVHEIGHNWDSQEENKDWAAFQTLSGWKEWDLTKDVPAGYVRAMNTFTSKSEPWIYLKSAGFAQIDGYGKNSPRDDFATALAATFRALTMRPNPDGTYPTPPGISPTTAWGTKFVYAYQFVMGQKLS